nr:hypothetical protein BaRGS_003118 [Batillaria attramentaria]
MSIIPVAISILVSFMSAILILGTPAEMYMSGTEYFVYVFGICFAIIIAALVFVPLLYPLRMTSSFEYLERRFNSRAAKLTGTIIMIVQQILYMGIASFAPSTALEAVTGFPVWATIIIVGLVSTFYTTLGGMKAVVWTDVFQSVIMLAGLLAVVIRGVMEVGGMDKVWMTNYEWDRIHFFNFNADPTQRHSFWSLIVGGMIGWTATYGCNQASVQRFCSLPSLAGARKSVLLNIIGTVILLTITCLAGIVIFAYYVEQGCDPLSSGRVGNSNQIVPYFVMEVLDIPGLPGLFVSCLFSGALSTMSSCLNALAAVTWEDFLKPVLGERLSEAQKTWVTKLLVLIYGGAGIGMAFMAQGLGGTVLQASLSFTGAASGPILGLFLLGGVFPWANGKGAVVGGVLGLIFPLWISIGAYNLPASPSSLPFPTNGCIADNATMTTIATGVTTLATTTTASNEISGIELLYTVSYLWYPAIGMATVIVVGLIISFITGPMDIDDIDPKYLIPIFDRLFCCLPASWRKTLRCHKEFPNPEDIKENDLETEIVIPDTDSKPVPEAPPEYNVAVLNGKASLKSFDSGRGNSESEPESEPHQVETPPRQQTAGVAQGNQVNVGEMTIHIHVARVGDNDQTGNPNVLIARVDWEAEREGAWSETLEVERRRADDRVRRLHRKLEREKRKAANRMRSLAESYTREWEEDVVKREEERARDHQQFMDQLTEVQRSAEERLSNLQSELREERERGEQRLAAMMEQHEDEKRQQQEQVMTFVIRVEGQVRQLCARVAAHVNGSLLQTVVQRLFDEFDVRLLAVGCGLQFLFDAPVAQWVSVVERQLEIQRVLSDLIPEGDRDGLMWAEVTQCGESFRDVDLQMGRALPEGVELESEPHHQVETPSRQDATGVAQCNQVNVGEMTIHIHVASVSASEESVTEPEGDTNVLIARVDWEADRERAWSQTLEMERRQADDRWVSVVERQLEIQRVLSDLIPEDAREGVTWAEVTQCGESFQDVDLQIGRALPEGVDHVMAFDPLTATPRRTFCVDNSQLTTQGDEKKPNITSLVCRTVTLTVYTGWIWPPAG